MAREKLHPRLILAVAAVATAAFVLSGCTAEDPAPVPTSDTPSSAPVFASDEEALAAAEEAFAAYQKTSDQILAEGGKRPERLLDVATQDVYEVQSIGYGEIAADGYHAVGHSSFDTVSLQSANLGGGTGAVVVYLCADISNTDIVDKSGKSIVRKDRVERWPLQLTFDYDKTKLLLADQSDWSGENFC